MPHHLAQVNIARTRAEFSDEAMHGLVSRIDDMYQLAETSPGFVWRLPGSESGPEQLTALQDYFQPFTPKLIFYNMSVWETVEHLRHYVYRTRHTDMLREKHAWIASFDRPQLALWWVPSGHRPSIAESVGRLRSLNEKGPTEYAFTLAQTFPPPDR